MEDFKNRLLEFARTQYDMGQSKFEDYCEINRGTISAIKVQGPTALIIMKISSKCPELNLNWLFRGTGSMTLGESSQPHFPPAPAVRVDNVQAVFITNWGDIQSVVENAVSKAMFNK